MYRKYELDDQLARNYVEDCLRNGHELARRTLAESHSLKDGRFFTFADANLDADRLHEFGRGGILTANRGKTYLYKDNGVDRSVTNTPVAYFEAADVIEHTLLSVPAAVCLFEDALARKSDPPVGDLNCLTMNDHVLYFLTKVDLGNQRVLSTIKEANAFLPIGVIGQFPGLGSSLAQMSDEIIQQVAASAFLVVVGAYDGESFVFWTTVRV